MTAHVQTVLGPVYSEDIGRCLPHEHVICDFSPVTGKIDHILNDVELAIDELALFKAAGGCTIVDITPPDLGRNVVALRTIARRSGVNIVTSTGWYRRAFYPPDLDVTPTGALAEIMVKELSVGIGDSGVRAGLIGEIGVDRDKVSAIEERVLRAAARAHLASNAPISTHSSMYPIGHVQLDILVEEQVPPSRIVIGHADTFLDIEYHESLLKRGVMLQFDTAGRHHIYPDLRRVKTFVRLVRAGWLERLLLSSDRCYRSDMVAFGGVGYAHVLTAFRALLLEHGLSSDEFDVVTIKNPARILCS